jgi:dipeptidyl aminopeptidase/acylaminoacyl peptidase
VAATQPDVIMACDYLASVFDARDSKEVRPWYTANQTETSIVGHFFGAPHIFDFETADGVKLYGMVYLPYHYVQGQTYPTLQFVYGGPGAQLVTNAYKVQKFSRLNMLSLLGYCVVVIDSRGSNNRGLAFEAYLKHRMVSLEFLKSRFNCQLTLALFIDWAVEIDH